MGHRVKWDWEVTLEELSKTFLGLQGLYPSNWLSDNYVQEIDNWDAYYKQKIQFNLLDTVICYAKAINYIAESWIKECECDINIKEFKQFRKEKIIIR